MKKSELRKIIREEIKRINEGDKAQNVSRNEIRLAVDWINQVRIIKWLDQHVGGYTVKTPHNEIIINTKKMNDSEYNYLIYYLNSQSYLPNKLSQSQVNDLKKKLEIH